MGGPRGSLRAVLARLCERSHVTGPIGLTKHVAGASILPKELLVGVKCVCEPN